MSLITEGITELADWSLTFGRSPGLSKRSTSSIDVVLAVKLAALKMNSVSL
jgi:hypothetical protein